MDCPICDRLQDEVEYLERDHAEKLDALGSHKPHDPEWRSAHTAEKNALEILETIRAHLQDHKAKHR